MLSRSAVLSELHNWGLVLYLGKQPGLGVRNLWSEDGGNEYTLDVDGAWRVAIFLTKWEEGSGFEPTVVEAVRVLSAAYKKSPKDNKRSMEVIAEMLDMKRSTVKRRYDKAVETMQRCYSLSSKAA